MKAIILAAGIGSRLAPLTNVLPKCLMPINGRPLIEYWILALNQAGIHEILINRHHHKDIMSEWSSNTRLSAGLTFVDEPILLGTGGTIQDNINFIGDSNLMVIHGDNLCLADIKDFIMAHELRPSDAVMTMMTFKTPTPSTCGIVTVDTDGLVIDFIEKPINATSNQANAAVYILEHEVIQFIKSSNKSTSDFSTEVLPNFIGRIFSWKNEIYHRDIGNVSSLFLAQEEFSVPANAPADDGWRNICVKFKLAKRLGKELSMITSDFQSLGYNVLIANDWEQDKYDVIKNARSLNSNGKLIVIIEKAKKGFSSKSIFFETGIRTWCLSIEA